MSDPLDVTGVWDGIFSYPRAMPPNHFVAELREENGRIVGETREPSDSPRDEASELHAFVEGTRSGADVAFTKFYDSQRRLQPISYHGTLDADGNEISGRWTIQSDWSGTFLMTRRAKQAAAETRETAETVR
ncbi:MAG: hypothetical protein ACTHM8_15395 [Sphingomonas sp.]